MTLAGVLGFLEKGGVKTTHVLKNCKLYYGGHDLSGDLNQITLEYGAAEKDATTFGNDSEVVLAGLKRVSLNHQGFVNQGTDGGIDLSSFDAIGDAEENVTVCPVSGADGEIAFCLKDILTAYNPGGAIGDVYAFTVSGRGAGDLIRGTVMAAGAKTSTANGTVRQLGAVLATQRVYAMLHVVAASGTNPTLDVVVESDDAADMVGATERIAFTQATAIGSELKSAAGAITDDRWRVRWTIGGTNTPTFTFIVIVGIQ